MKRRGFTLIELLLVIGIIGILAAVVIVAVNPSRQLASAQNARRQANIRAILDAFAQYAIDHNGNYQVTNPSPPADCSIPLSPAPPRKLCTEGVTTVTCDFDAASDGNGCIPMSQIAPVYLVGVPPDPQDLTGGDEDSMVDYSVRLADQGKRLAVFALRTQIPPATDILSVTR